MRYGILTTAAAALCGTIALGATAANAQQTASLSSCLDMANQVKSALVSNAQSPNYHDAVKQQGYGRDFCTNGLYRNGVEHYAAALKLLGVGKS